jgi:protein gp37
MSDGTKIEWTDATWNPITGCSVLSPGCARCYAMKLAGTRMKNHPSRRGLTIDSKAGPIWNGEVRFNEEWLTQPRAWKRPRRIFVCAHGDLFHENVPDAWIDRVFAVMGTCPQHTFQVLTKRSARMQAYCKRLTNARIVAVAANIPGTPREGRIWREPPFPNVWLGVSAEDQARADERIPDLLQTPAAIRFVSLEPLLGPIDLTNLGNATMRLNAFTGEASHLLGFKGKTLGGLDWVITGGESGPHARPMYQGWTRSICDQCASAGAAYFHKQNGEHLWSEDNGGVPFRVGKRAAGRLLDGREHNGMPGGAP